MALGAYPLLAPRVVRGGRPFLAIFDWSRGRLIGTSDVGPEKGMTYGLTEWLTHGPSEVEGRTPRIVAADSRNHLWQGHLSPNGRWIAFVAQRIAGEQEAMVEIVPENAANTTERDWTPVASRGSWADKPRWSPDGRMLYFVELAARFFDLSGCACRPGDWQAIGAAIQDHTIRYSGDADFPRHRKRRDWSFRASAHAYHDETHLQHLDRGQRGPLDARPGRSPPHTPWSVRAGCELRRASRITATANSFP